MTMEDSSDDMRDEDSRNTASLYHAWEEWYHWRPPRKTPFDVYTKTCGERHRIDDIRDEVKTYFSQRHHLKYLRAIGDGRCKSFLDFSLVLLRSI
jgi:hypothetical protein